MKEYRLTKEGYDKLIEEREDLVSNKRKEIAARLKEAKEASGELSENTEYEYAKNEQAFIEGRIEQINEILNKHVIIEGNNHNDSIDIGSNIEVKDLDSNKKRKYMLVSSVESDPENHKISDESPMGRALLSRKVGDVIQVKTPQSMIRLKVLKIN
ncbi:MAG: transcription elongation factor GreA [Actinomycetota bacterium]|nr:MAG: transcription elongation factor GreA [Actinomycetota bacterium]